jgi:hypothetical protein
MPAGMTIPAGAGSESAGSRQQTHVPDDADDPGLPAATGNSAAGGPPSGDIQGGGPITDAVRDQAPTGVGSARFGSAEHANAESDKGETGGLADSRDPVGTDDPSGV